MVFLRCGLVLFDSAAKKNLQTKSNHVIELKNDPNRSKPNVYVVFLLDWFGFKQPYFWFASNLISLWNTTWNPCFHNLCRADRVCDVESYLDFDRWLKYYVAKNHPPVYFRVTASLHEAYYGQIAKNLRWSNSLSGRRDRIIHPRPNHCQGPILCRRVEHMKAICNVFGRHWKVIMCPRLDNGDCKTAKLLVEMRKFQFGLAK